MVGGVFMIENIRKNYKLSKLLNTFHISWISSIIIMIINHIGILNKINLFEKIISPLPLFFLVLGFSSISMCIIAYLGNLKEVYNDIWFKKIISIILGIVTAIILTQSLVNKESVNSLGMLYTFLGVIYSMYLVKNIDNK